MSIKYFVAKKNDGKFQIRYITLEQTAELGLEIPTVEETIKKNPFFKDSLQAIGCDIDTSKILYQFICQAGKKVQGTFIRDNLGKILQPSQKAILAEIDYTSLGDCTNEIYKYNSDIPGPGVLCQECSTEARKARGKKNKKSENKTKIEPVVNQIAPVVSQIAPIIDKPDTSEKKDEEEEE